MIAETDIPKTAQSLQVDFKMRFNDAPLFTERDDIELTAYLTIGALAWDESDTAYQDIDLYIYSDIEITIPLTRLINP